MPIIFVTFLTLITAFLANKKKIEALLSVRKNKEYEAAPSVLSGTYQYKEENSKSLPKSKRKK